ncbi:DUF1289 domain-containing protein [Amylibacter sp. SFDW26]|uniref:DUF1289 domain-containing protein n=1 Tax=Amylibacter sp. SFDW26 TaxID=2652722 RepID=UPI0012625F77|nr:DUF1289 domain-containing protein [Amylibacter sp. SFDW26]KAB7615195.1 DUF1289 domain-containing protein [Amylibacter sp. SFDW26]
MAKIPSPCVDVCKYKRQGHCIACSMTKAQKSLFKELKKPKHQQAYIDMLVLQQERLGKFDHWHDAYAKKCRKKGVKNPLAKM